MLNAILLSDLHLHHSPLWRLEWNSLFLDRLLSNYADTHELFLLGDVFESKDRIDCRVLNQFLALVGEWKQPVYWISGQHDSYQPGIASLEGLSHFGIKVIDRQVVKHERCPIYFLPYAREIENYRAMLATIPKNSYVMTHIPTEEALFAQGVDVEGISVYEFAAFKHTYSGDIHGYLDFLDANFSYVGTPSQRDWRDKKVKGAYGVFSLSSDGVANFKRILTRHPIHVEITKNNQVLPADRKLIVKASADVQLDPSSEVLEYTTTYEQPTHVAVSGSHGQTVSQLLSDYVDKVAPQEGIYKCNAEFMIQKGTELYEKT